MDLFSLWKTGGLMRRIVLMVVAAACTAPVALGAAAEAQQWTWPETPENLQVLPKDWPGRRLAPVMRGFTRALGVRCSHCHVGEEGQPLSTYDFASDDNPKKDVARTMLRMLGVINDSLRTFETSGPQRVNMWCHTCHRSRPRPTTLDEEIRDAFAAGGTEAALAHYWELRERYYGAGTLDFREGPLNQVGYELLGKGEIDGAIAMFALNVELFPESANVYDSLAEGYMTKGELDLARTYYRKSLELNPQNQNARRMLQEMEGQ
jgi:tetratricopeptide (TPR) repeat protein